MRERSGVARAVVAVALGVMGAPGCVASRTISSPVTDVELPDPPRRPDGVVVEPAPALPVATERAPSNGVVVLREPLGDDAVVAVVRAMFRAFAHEDREALAALLTADAAPLGAGHVGARGALLDQWSARLRSMDYGLLEGLEVARLDRMERRTYADLAAGGGDRPSMMRPGDLLVRVPVATPRAGAEPLFGDVVVLLLRREGAAFKIAGEGEE